MTGSGALGPASRQSMVNCAGILAGMGVLISFQFTWTLSALFPGWTSTVNGLKMREFHNKRAFLTCMVTFTATWLHFTEWVDEGGQGGGGSGEWGCWGGGVTSSQGAFCPNSGGASL